MMPYPPQMHAPPPARKGMNGCVIALIVVGSIVLLGAVAAGIGVYAFATSDVGKTTFKVIGEGSKIVDKGMKAPGTTEMRGLGCDTAMVIDMKDFSTLMTDILDGGPDAALPDGLMVTCQVRSAARAPSCDTVAATYVRAVGTATSPFVVSVQVQGNNNPVCQSTYDATGAFIGGGTTTTTGPRRHGGI